MPRQREYEKDGYMEQQYAEQLRRLWTPEDEAALQAKFWREQEKR